MSVYTTIRRTRKILNDLYGTRSHTTTMQILGIKQSLYNEIRYYDAVTVAEKITPDIQKRLEDFCALHTINQEKEKIESLGGEYIKPKEPVQVFVNNDVKNIANLKLNGKAMDMVNAMSKLRDAMEPFFEMGYHIGVTLYRKTDAQDFD